MEFNPESRRKPSAMPSPFRYGTPSQSHEGATLVEFPGSTSFEPYSPTDESTPSTSIPTNQGSEEPSPSLQCSYPDCSFRPGGRPENLEAYLRKHMATHNQRYRHKCSHCTKTFSRRDNLRVHKRKSHNIGGPI
ncbi:hypothetical protein F4820DRAFT_432180 [Hypoxylon rubiginosum]|uniref:Uncharacterized protein n=1 Tax=Hypoxylon rubiginosum TaxID=110542 RepID=A0ACB9YRT7_9PEZI|nr:hypothetical protein F4820DRAFT_432180 [Hypoxylon rubiginosum]